jgi:hypothetical protein
MSSATWLAALLVLPWAVATAQAIPFSQHGTVSQRVGLTDILVEYNRPVARGRVLFGPAGLVRPGRIWHPGADSASRITFSRDVVIEGHEVRAGTYSLWLLPGEGEPWTLILSRAARVYHTPYPGERLDALRAPVRPDSGQHMEVMAFYFPVVAPDSAVLRLHWGTTIVPIRIRAPARDPD